MSDPLRDEALALAEQFRRALAEGNYDQAHALLALQRQQLEKHCASPESAPFHGTAVLRQILEALEWARLVAATARADAAMELNQLRHSALYRAALPASKQTWQLTA